MIFALVIGTLLEDFRLQPDRIAADVAQRTDQWVSKPFAPAQGLSAAEFRATYLGVVEDAPFATASFGGGAPPMTRERRVEAMRGNCLAVSDADAWPGCGGGGVHAALQAATVIRILG